MRLRCAVPIASSLQCRRTLYARARPRTVATRLTARSAVHAPSAQKQLHDAQQSAQRSVTSLAHPTHRAKSPQNSDFTPSFREQALNRTRSEKNLTVVLITTSLLRACREFGRAEVNAVLAGFAAGFIALPRSRLAMASSSLDKFLILHSRSSALAYVHCSSSSTPHVHDIVLHMCDTTSPYS